MEEKTGRVIGGFRRSGEMLVSWVDGGRAVENIKVRTVAGGFDREL